MYVSARERRVEIAGASSDARDCWAAERVVEGVSSKCCVLLLERNKEDGEEWEGIGKMKGRRIRTRVDERTFLRRGKSDIPESRIEIEESRRVREERREVTDAEREVSAWDWETAMAVCCFVLVSFRRMK